MRVCLLYGGTDKESHGLKVLADALARGIAQQEGNPVVEVFNMHHERGRKVSCFDFIIMGTEASTLFGGRIPPIVADFLKDCGSLAGKRCFCFISKKGLRKGRTLGVLMKALETEGVFVSNFNVLDSPSLAAAVGKRLKLTKDQASL
ncbi:MAG: flavodoxin family protein [Sphaerochaetaceae bacterium]